LRDPNLASLTIGDLTALQRIDLLVSEDRIRGPGISSGRSAPSDDCGVGLVGSRLPLTSGLGWALVMGGFDEHVHPPRGMRRRGGIGTHGVRGSSVDWCGLGSTA